MNQSLYPISEIFTSPQGEGVYAGQMQTFIRLAGCTVGKRYPAEKYGTGKHQLPVYVERCTLYDGRTFACDTDYRSKMRLTAEAIIDKIPAGVDDVCITGGEPLMHELHTLITYLIGVGRKIHIETSGTLYVDLPSDIWITVSPKNGCLSKMITRADEIKLLVDKDFNPEAPLIVIGKSELYPSGEYYFPTLAYKKPVFLQPVNGEKEISPQNLSLCLEWQRRFPGFRVSLQTHKVMSQILSTEVR